MGVADAPNGIRVREVLAVRGLKLVDQTGPGEAAPSSGTTWRLPEPRAGRSWRLGRAADDDRECRREHGEQNKELSSLEVPFVWC